MNPRGDTPTGLAERNAELSYPRTEAFKYSWLSVNKRDMVFRVAVDGNRVVLEFSDVGKLAVFLELLRRLGVTGVEKRELRIDYNEKFYDYLLRDRNIDRRTVKDYMRYLKKLAGKVINYDLYLEISNNKWMVKLVRLYLDYLYKINRISLEELQRLKGIFKLKSTKEVKWHEVNAEDLISKVLSIKEGSLYRLILELLLYSGARLSEVVKMLKTWDGSRLACFEDRGFCRYGLFWHRGRKRCDWIYMPMFLVGKVEEMLSKKRAIGNYDTIRKDIYENYKVKEKDFRKLFYRICREVTDKEVCDFVQSRISSLTIGDLHYDNLLQRADAEYPKVVKKIGELVDSALCSMSGVC